VKAEESNRDAGTGLALSLDEEAAELFDARAGLYCGAGEGGMDVGKGVEPVVAAEIVNEGKLCDCEVSARRSCMTRLMLTIEVSASPLSAHPSSQGSITA